MRFSGKKIAVTGASRGIGRAIAEAFRAEGAWVAGTSTHKRQPDDICQEWIQADFAEMRDIAHCAERVQEYAPDVLINNAGINKIAPFAEISDTDFMLIQQVNVFAPFALMRSVLPGMKAKGWGRIVNVSSVWGKIGKERRASYSASKFALDGLTVALAAECSADGVIVNSVAPGFIDTELTKNILGEDGIRSVVATVPARRLGTTEEIARLVIWLASDENTFVAGQNISIDGGFSRV